MSYPCAPATPPLPNQVNPATYTPPLPVPVLPSIAVRLPSYAVPRYITDFPVSRPAVAYFLATLARASYQPTAALFTAAARSVVPGSYPVTYVANQADTPGYGVVRLPQAAIVVISGTTNLAQWLRQIFLNSLVEWGPVGSLNVEYRSMSVYIAAANAINTALGPVVPNDVPILYVGHSMGGVVAQLLHALSTYTGAPRVASRCTTFAAPKPGDAALADGMRTTSQVYRRWMLDGDFVPILPPDIGWLNLLVPDPLKQFALGWSSYRQPTNAYFINENGTIRNDVEPFLPTLVAGAMAAVVAGRPLTPVVVHNMGAYCDRLRLAAATSLPGMRQAGWNDPENLNTINDQLTQLGF